MLHLSCYGFETNRLLAAPAGDNLDGAMKPKRCTSIATPRSPMTFARLLLVAPLIASSLAAQSAQPCSVQGSGLYTVVAFGAGENVGGAGIETQVRYTPGRFSIGLGYQLSWHSTGGDDMRLQGAFLEPRMSIDLGRERWALYLAGRVVRLRSVDSWERFPHFAVDGLGLGGGAGLITFLSPRMNLDFGAAYLRQTLESKTFSSQSSVTFDPLNGFVAKVGVSVGIGER
jgi:hypothetical protein